MLFCPLQLTEDGRTGGHGSAAAEHVVVELHPGGGNVMLQYLNLVVNSAWEIIQTM